MSISSKLDPKFFERNRNEVIIFLVNSIGFVVYFVFGINAIAENRKEDKNGPHENSQFSIVVCAGALAMQTSLIFIKTLWNRENIVPQVALASLLFEEVGLMILLRIVNIDWDFEKFVTLLLAAIPVFVIAGTVLIQLEEDRKKELNQADKRHTDNKKKDDNIKSLERGKRSLEMELLESRTDEKNAVKLKETQESMEGETKVLTKQSKLMGAEKKKLEIDLAVKREREGAQKDIDVPKKGFEARTSTVHPLQAEKLRKMEVEGLRMKGEIRVLKELHEYEYSKWKKNVETIAMLRYKNERREEEVNKIEKICVDLRKSFDDMRKNRISFHRVEKKAFGDAEQALGELTQSVLLLQQQR